MEKALSNSEIFQDIEEYASENYIPIIRKEELLYLEELIEKDLNQKRDKYNSNLEKENTEENVQNENGSFVYNILEIGTAIGYSASKFALIDDDIHIDTIEIDSERCKMALDNITKFAKQDQVNIINGDAEVVLDEMIKNANKYDLIFIDANKSKDKNYFIKSEELIADSGIIVCDNIYMSGLTLQKEEGVPKKHRTIYRNIHKFLNYLNGNDDFKTELVDISDGLTVSYYNVED